MEDFTAEELNAMGVIVSAAAIKGQDAKFIAALLEKIAVKLKAVTAE